MLFTPLGLVVAAVAALGGYFLYSTGIAGQAVEYLKGVFATLKAETLAAFGAIANALAAGDITAATDVLWSYLKLQWTKGTTFLQAKWAEFTQYISDVWADSAYAIGDVLIGALSGLAGVWNSTLGFMADGWTILTSAVQKGWNNTIGFLKKGFLKLHELVDIAGDVSVQIGGVLINALAGVEKAWVETVDYLADTWTVFVGQVKSMWNSTVGFLKKAWIKLKGLFDDDINVDVEMAKIDVDTRAADAAEEQQRQQAIIQRQQRRAQRKQQIEANRVEMQKGIADQLAARKKAREGNDIDADMRAIDVETDAKNASVDESKEQQFRENDTAQENRQDIIDDTTSGVQATLAQMRADAKAAREASRPDDTGDSDREMEAAQAEFDAAVERANNATAPSDDVDPAKNDTPASPPTTPPVMPAPGEVDIPKVDVPLVDLPGIDDPELQPPHAKDLRLDLNPDAQAAMDQFANGPASEQDNADVSGDFDSRGLELGSGASRIPQIDPQPIKKLEPIPLPENEVVEEILAPQLMLEPVEPKPINDIDAPQVEAIEAVTESPTLDIAAITEAFAMVGRSLVAFDAALSGTTTQLQLPNASSGEFSEDMKRAIIQTAENTRRIRHLLHRACITWVFTWAINSVATKRPEAVRQSGWHSFARR